MESIRKHGSYNIQQWKKDEIDCIVKLIKSHSVVGILSFEGILGNQFQKMRQKLRKNVILKVTRNTLIEKALLDSSLDSNISELKRYISSQTALIFTNENPFTLYKLLENIKTKTHIKSGSIAPFDITVNKGPTNFPPGPILGELQSSGIPVSVVSGKITVKENKIVCKSGQKMNPKLATALLKLEIYPLEVGLILNAAYNSGTIFDSNDLNIDVEKYNDDFTQCIKNGINLSINILYLTSNTVDHILSDVHRKALNLGINSFIYNSETIEYLISKVIIYAYSLSIQLFNNNKNFEIQN